MNDPDDHESQAVRRRVLRNDRLVREQATTFHQFAAVEAEEIRGRFGSTEKATVIGSTPAPDYPAAYQQRDPVPTEPPLTTSSRLAMVRSACFTIFTTLLCASSRQSKRRRRRNRRRPARNGVSYEQGS